jgi:hypothetical protein
MTCDQERKKAMSKALALLKNTTNKKRNQTK